MSGIAGFVDAGSFRKPSPAELEAMLQRLEGSAEAKPWLSRSVGLAGTSPVVAGAASRTVLVFEGWLSNGARIRKELQARRRRLRGESDADTALGLYEEEGDKGLDRLRGPFVLALWDDRFKKCLCLRDRMGLKSLYYAFQDGCFYFSSTLDSLAGVPRLKPRVDASRLPLLLSMGYLPGTQTLFRGLRRLAPGHALILQKGRLQISRRAARDRTELGVMSEAGEEIKAAAERDDESRFYINRLRGFLKRSVSENLGNGTSTGILLSGDLNSGLVAALACQEKPRLPSFSISFKDEKGGEPGAREAFKLSKALGTDHAELAMNPEGFAEVLPQWVRHMDEGWGDPRAVPEFFLSLFARRKARRVLGSQGADELFAGAPVHALAGREREGLPAWKRALVGFRSLFKKEGAASSLMAAAEAAALNPGLGRYLGYARTSSADRLLRVLGDSVERTWEESKLEEAYRSYFEEEDFLNSCLRADLGTWIPGGLLPRLEAMSAAAGLDLALPYMDSRLADLAQEMPSNLKVRHGLGKWVLREAAKGLVPGWVIRDKRPASSVPLSSWLRGPLREVLVETLTSKACRERGLFNEKGVDEMLAAHFAGQADYGATLWSLLVLEARLAQA